MFRSDVSHVSRMFRGCFAQCFAMFRMRNLESILAMLGGWFFGAQLDQPSGEAPARPNWRPERKMRTRMVDVTESAWRCEAEASGSAHLPSGYLARLI